MDTSSNCPVLISLRFISLILAKDCGWEDKGAFIARYFLVGRREWCVKTYLLIINDIINEF